jgi:hypothetical protein
MPANQQNKANAVYKEFIKMCFKISENNPILSKTESKTWWSYDDKGVHHLIAEKTAGGAFVIKDSYKKFIYNGIKYGLINYGKKINPKPVIPYFISFKNLILDHEHDELFSYLNINFKDNGLSSKNINVKTQVTGINENSKMVSLKRDSIKKLKNTNYLNNTLPIIANTYFLEYYKHKVGEVIKVEVTNKADRNINKEKSYLNLKIVGEEKSYNGIKMYTLRDYANKTLGLNKLSGMKNNNNKYQYFNGDQKAFNGVYSNANNPVMFNTLSLYSASGFYPGTDKIDRKEIQETGSLSKTSILNNIKSEIKSPR